MTPYSEGLKTGTITAGTVLADTGALSANTYSILFWLSVSVDATIRFERRNAANDATIWSQTFSVSAAAPVVIPQGLGLVLDADERFRIVAAGLIVGQAQGTLFLS